MGTESPFALALRELVIENDYVTQTGKPNWAAFASELGGFERARENAALWSTVRASGGASY